MEKNKNSVMALGALLALSMMLLAVVTTGWVCTCLIRQSSAQNRFCELTFNINTYSLVLESLIKIVSDKQEKSPDCDKI